MTNRTIGIDQLGKLLGLNPTLHDSEIIKLVADSAADSVTISMRAKNIEGKSVDLDIVMEGISEFEMLDFRYQNVVFRIEIDNEEPHVARLDIDSTIGLSGKIAGRDLKIFVDSQYIARP